MRGDAAYNRLHRHDGSACRVHGQAKFPQSGFGSDADTWTRDIRQASCSRLCIAHRPLVHLNLSFHSSSPTFSSAPSDALTKHKTLTIGHTTRASFGPPADGRCRGLQAIRVSNVPARSVWRIDTAELPCRTGQYSLLGLAGQAQRTTRLAVHTESRGTL